MVQQYLKLLSDGRLHQTFVSDLVWEIVEVLRYPLTWDEAAFPSWDDYDSIYGQRITRKSLWSCCLVCREWNELFTPALYETIVIDNEKMGTYLFQTLLRYRPTHKDLIHAIEVECHNSPHGWTPILVQLPNLRDLTMHQFDLSRSHPRLSRLFRVLPDGCETWIYGEEVFFHQQLLPQTFQFIRHSQPDHFDLVVRLSQNDPSRHSMPSQLSPLYRPNIYLTATARVGKCQVDIVFPRIRKDQDIASVNFCLGFFAQHLEELSFTYRGSIHRTLDFDLQNNRNLQSLQIRFPTDTDLSDCDQWRETLPWFESLCSTVMTGSKTLDVVIECPPDDSDFCAKIEDTLLEIMRDGRAPSLSVELGKIWAKLPQGHNYWEERFPHLRRGNMVIVH